jgi:hypothetical protein
MNCSRSLSALAAALAGGFLAMAQNTASIQGTMVDSATGKPLAGAVIIATKTAPPVKRAVATSTFDGSFQLPSLPAGTYTVCVQSPQDGYLATCHWGGTASTLTLATAQKSTGTEIAMKVGSVLKIHVDDPKQLLNQKTKDGYAPHLVMGVWSGGQFYAARTAAKATTSADYQVTIPFDTNLNFTIQSRNLNIGDAKGNALPSNGDQQSFQHASTESSHVSFGYTILSAIQ